MPRLSEQSFQAWSLETSSSHWSCSLSHRWHLQRGGNSWKKGRVSSAQICQTPWCHGSLEKVALLGTQNDQPMCGYHGSLLALWLIASHDRAWILCWCANYECLGLKISSYFYNKPQESVSQVKVLVCAIPIWAWITVRLRGAQCGKPNQSHHPNNHQLYRGSLKNHRHKVILTHLAAGTASGEDIFARRAKSTPLVVMVLSLGSSNRCLNPNTLGIPIYAHGLLLDILDNLGGKKGNLI